MRRRLAASAERTAQTHLDTFRGINLERCDQAMREWSTILAQRLKRMWRGGGDTVSAFAMAPLPRRRALMPKTPQTETVKNQH